VIDRSYLAIAILFVAGYASALMPRTLSWPLVATCLCFLSGVVARRLIDSWARKEWS
jgi:hypothetical protein